jgi:TATA-box binding protein (TBP) (component of TFIID and TFIIIB)
MSVTNQVYVATCFPAGGLEDIKVPKNGICRYSPPWRIRAGILRTGKGTLLLYPNGSVVINKCKSFDDVDETILQCFDATGILITEPELVNVVGCIKLNRKVCLETIFPLVPKAVLEPDLHCGLLFYLGNVSVIVYHTGTIIFAGCRTMENFNYVAETIRILARLW